MGSKTVTQRLYSHEYERLGSREPKTSTARLSKECARVVPASSANINGAPPLSGAASNLRHGIISYADQ